MADEVVPVWIVESPLVGEEACEELRAHGIKCACVEMPSERARTSPTRFLSAGFGGMEWKVIVSPPDIDGAEQVLTAWFDARPALET
jgi:hypothetical protein